MNDDDPDPLILHMFLSTEDLCCWSRSLNGCWLPL